MAFNSNKRCRVFLIPQLSKGHLIPMTDFAKLLTVTHPDVETTIAVTPGNVALIDSLLGQSRSSGRVQIVTYPFPSEGLKTNNETICIGVGTKVEEASVIHEKFELFRPAHEELLSKHKPDVVLVDSLISWVPGIAAALGIPCLFFFCSGIFPLVVYRCISEMQPNVGFDDQITVSGLPGPEIVMPIRELPNFKVGQDEVSNQILHSLFGSWPDVSGIVFNTFRALESDYCKEYERVQTKRAYFVGPIAFSSHNGADEAIGRGGEGDTACLRWLDGKEDRSVVYVSFGSQWYLKSEQLLELAKGLEDSRRNFLWVVRADNMEWLPDGWEDRVAGRGFVVKGWAPQVATLSHPATGAFISHCGWNSILEGISAGMPMLTWPIGAEQFINERLLVEVIGCAARVWDGGKRSVRETEHELVPACAIARAVAKFMDSLEEGEYAATMMRAQAQRMAASAQAALEEGGSSWGDLRSLVNDLIGSMHGNKLM